MINFPRLIALALLLVMPDVHAAWSGISASINEVESVWLFEGSERNTSITRLNIYLEERTSYGLGVGANLGQSTTRLSNTSGPRNTLKFDANHLGVYLHYPMQLGEQLPIFDQPLTDSDLQFVFAGVPKVDVVNILHQPIDVTAGVGATDVVARIERHPQPFDVVAQDDDRVGILGKTPDLRPDAHQDAFHGCDGHQASKMFDFFVERRAQFGRGHGERDDLCGFGEFATRGELAVVLLAGGVNLNAVGSYIQTKRISANVDSSVQIGGNLRWFELVELLVQGDFTVRKLQINHALQGIGKRQIEKTFRCGSDDHSKTPSTQLKIRRHPNFGRPPQ